ncbi:MAG: TRAP transporter substrate-binding protein DctP [Alphaproteobacteria bacterium]
MSVCLSKWGAAVGVAGAALVVANTAGAANHTLRIQTHFSAESTPGQIVAQFIDDVQVMSGGRLDVQIHYSSEVVAQNETFGAAQQGILDCDMTGASGNVGKDVAFQFAGDIMGGYDTPYQMIGWLEFGGGRELVQELYDRFDMHLVGWWLQGHESLSSTRPLAGPADLVDWKFRSPPGMETAIFAALGAKPVVMDFGEVPTALRTGIVDGADASTLNTNQSLGLFDTATYATFPGFHSMPTEQLSCNKEAWDALSPDLQRIMEVALTRSALSLAIQTEIRDNGVAVELAEQGVTLHDWSADDRKRFREFARDTWQVFAGDSELAQRMVASHVAYMQGLGLIE